MKDWVGNKTSIFATLAATSHGREEREENDFYATDPIAIDILIEEGEIHFPTKDILEPSAGQGHLSERLKQHGYNVTSYDLVDRGYCDCKDFFTIDKWKGSIVTNPPYKIAKEFVEHSLEIIDDGMYVAMFLKLQFLEGKERKKLFKSQPPKWLLVSSSRLNCAKGARFDIYTSSAVAYGWYVWEKGFVGDTKIKWVN